MLKFLGRTCARHHWVVLALWVLAAVGASVSASLWGGETTNDFSIPGSDSQEALDVLAEDFPQLAGTSATVVFETTGETVDEFEDAIQQAVANLESIDGVASVSNPLSTSTQLLNSQTSANGTIAYSTVLLPASAQDLPEDTYDKVVGASQVAVDAGLNVQFSGSVVDTLNPPTSTLSDYADEIGLAVALVLLLFVFRSVFIAVLPMVRDTIIGVAFAGGVVDPAPELVHDPQRRDDPGHHARARGRGGLLAVHPDPHEYGELEEGRSPEEAFARALSTAGRAVLFAGITICLATVALVLVGIPLISQMGIARGHLHGHHGRRRHDPRPGAGRGGRHQAADHQDR